MAANNGFFKYLTKEDNLQLALCNYLKMAYRDVIFHHSPNEGKRSYFERFKLKIMGVSSGFPDLFIPIAKGGYHGLFIELKIKPNKCTDNQKKWIKYIIEQGYKADICYDFDEAKKVIDDYLS